MYIYNIICIYIILYIYILLYVYIYIPTIKHLSYCRYKPTQLTTRGTEMQTSLMDCKEWKSPSANVH